MDKLLLTILGVGAGFGVSAGLFALIVGLGVVSDFADRTHTGKYVLLYEDCIALGGIVGNIFYFWSPKLVLNEWNVLLLGLFTGIFVGSWSVALTEILNIFPIFMRRSRLTKGIAFFVICMAVGKGLGAIWYFILGG